MKMALVGAAARSLCAAAGAQGFAALSGAAGCPWDVLALLRGTQPEALGAPLVAGILLLPESAAPAGHLVRARQAVVYGFSPRDTLTLSSTSLACLQRALIAPSGAVIEPQELPLPPEYLRFGMENALLLALLRLLRSQETAAMQKITGAADA